MMCPHGKGAEAHHECYPSYSSRERCEVFKRELDTGHMQQVNAIRVLSDRVGDPAQYRLTELPAMWNQEAEPKTNGPR